MCFELRSPDNEILGIARSVFSRWPAPAGARLRGQWEIHRNNGRFEIYPEPVAPPGTTIPDIGTPGQAVTLVEYAAIWRIVEHCQDILCFHSALLAKDGKSVAIVGPSEAGKSTLSAGLWQNGWSFLCDDTTLVTGVRASPGPRRVSLREGSRGLLGEDLWSSIADTAGYQKTIAGCLFHPSSEYPLEAEVSLSAIVFLKRNGAPADAEGPTRLIPANAAIALLPYTNLVRTLAFSEALAPVATLMSEVPAWDLPRAPLSEMIESVEQLAGVAQPAIA